MKTLHQLQHMTKGPPKKDLFAATDLVETAQKLESVPSSRTHMAQALIDLLCCASANGITADELVILAEQKHEVNQRIKNAGAKIKETIPQCFQKLPSNQP